MDAALTDGSFAKVVQIPYSDDNHAWVQYAYTEPQPVQAIVFGAAAGVQFGGPAIPSGKIEASEDGQSWRTLVPLPGPRAAPARSTSRCGRTPSSL